MGEQFGSYERVPLSLLATENHLAECRNVTVILRLVLDQHGRLSHGELVDVAGTLQQRFIGWRGMIRAECNWLMRQEQDDTADDTQAT